MSTMLQLQKKRLTTGWATNNHQNGNALVHKTGAFFSICPDVNTNLLFVINHLVTLQ
jgi:hypothetical protein